jgi:hypothetical protein
MLPVFFIRCLRENQGLQDIQRPALIVHAFPSWKEIGMGGAMRSADVFSRWGSAQGGSHVPRGRSRAAGHAAHDMEHAWRARGHLLHL